MSFFRVLTPMTRIGTMSLRQSPAKEQLIQSVRNYCSPQQPLVFEVKDFPEFMEKVIETSHTTPVIVDCYADWCGPCKNLTPRLEEKINNRGGQVLLAKINVDLAGELAVDLAVTAVPTVIAVRNGEGIGSFTGDHPDENIDNFIDRLIEGEIPVVMDE